MQLGHLRPAYGPYLPATGPNLFRKQGYPAHAGNCYCARLARLHAIFSEPTSVIRQRWQLSQGGGWWWSLKGPTYYWHDDLTRGSQPLAGSNVRAGIKWIIHMSWNLPRFSRGPSSRVPICHKCAQERIIRRCFARVALLGQFPPRPKSTLLSRLCAVWCTLHTKVTVSLRVEVVECSAGGPYYLLSTPTHPDRSDSLNYGWPSSSVADQY